MMAGWLALVLALTLQPVVRPPTAGATAERLPPGVYTTTIAEQDVPPSFPPNVVALLVGQWQLELTEAGSYIAVKDGDVVVMGRYTSNPVIAVLTDLSGPLACSHPAFQTSEYQWAFDNDELTLTVIHDPCGPRAVVMTAHPLQKQ